MEESIKIAKSQLCCLGKDRNTRGHLKEIIGEYLLRFNSYRKKLGMNILKLGLVHSKTE